MPYDPNLPLENTEIEAAEMRAQLQGLKELIDLIAPGTITAVFIDSITVVGPFDPPAASVSLVGTELHFTFAIPRGQDGTAGAPGSVINGAQVDSVSSVNPADPASASASYDGSILHFSFGIPRGIDGTNGAPGEVSNATLAAEIAGTARNPTSVPPLNLTVSDPPTTAEVQAIANRLDELRAGLLR
jgi:hypothetical protein